MSRRPGKSKITIPVLIVVLSGLLAAINPQFIDGYIENLSVDYRFRIRNLISPPPVSRDIVMVLIDEKSLAQYGRWPWNRGLQAELIEKVFNDSPRAVAVDIFYPEPESPQSDSALAGVFRKHADKLVVALGYEVNDGDPAGIEIADTLYDDAIQRIDNLKAVNAPAAELVLLPPEPVAGAATFGHAYYMPDRDGRLRWDSLYIRYGDEYFPSLPLQVARIAAGIPMEKIVIRGGEGVLFDGRLLPTDEFGRLHINYLGKEGSFIHRSAADVLSGNIEKGFFKNRIVLIGTSALATYDIKITPLSANMPGVEKNANVVANILGNNFIRKTPLTVDLLIVLAAGVVTVLLSSRLSAIGSILMFIFSAVFMMAAGQVAFIYYGWRMNFVYPLSVIISEGMFIISHRYFVEEKRARLIKKMFSNYVTERVVNELIRDPEMAKLGGERREVTVLFADIGGFTAFSERHEPEEVVARLNEYLGAMTDVIFRWEGTLDKFIGDAIVAFWGAPMKQDNHAELAVRCALNMIKRLEELRQKWISEGKPPLNIGIGLNTGEVIVGNIGADGKKMDYTVIGDHVNIGARVESLTRKFNTDILMTELPLSRIAGLVRSGGIGHISIKGVGNVVVKGKERPIKLYEVRSLEHAAQSVIIECEDESVMRMKEK